MTAATKTRLAGLLILAVLVYWLVTALSHYPGIVGPDSRDQYQLMLAGVYRNWKPALYEWQFFVGENLWKGHGLALAFIAQIVVMGSSIAWIIWHYAKRNYLYALCILGLLVLFTAKTIGFNSVVNDYMAAACYLLYIASILAASERSKGVLRHVCIIIAVLSLFYGMVLRHNAVFMVILLAYWGGGKLFSMSRLKRGLSSVCCVAAFLVSGHCINAYFLQCEPSYPLRSAFADDIINISTLGNKWEPVCERHFDTAGHAPGKTIFIPEAGHWNPILSGLTQEDDLTERKENYLIIRDGWVESVSSHPLRYIVIKAFLYHQFLLSGKVLPWACDLLHHYYPHVRIFMEPNSRKAYAWLNREFIIFSVIPLSAYLLLSIIGFRVLVRRKWSIVSSLPEESKDALYIIGASLLYTLSFVPFVLSVSEIRYYSIRATLTYVGLSILVLSTLIAWIRKNKERNCTE